MTVQCAMADFAPDGRRYAEVFSVDGAKLGCLARVQVANGWTVIDVGGFLSVYPASLTLPASHLHFGRDQDGVVFASAALTKSAALELLAKQHQSLEDLAAELIDWVQAKRRTSQSWL